ncbi:hypothetical protein SUGI_0303770 [Cryptomeria japonica]|nr:hypothetical protein SUGI_0303770 [Cryptomeria japonica]
MPGREYGEAVKIVPLSMRGISFNVGGRLNTFKEEAVGHTYFDILPSEKRGAINRRSRASYLDVVAFARIVINFWRLWA